jgi:hypothetical protein
MLYRLDELLTKMGAPEAREKGSAEWHYFRSNMSGLAEVRLEAGGERLVAELRHVRESREEDEIADLNGLFVETCSLRAERTEDGLYAVTRVAFDGTEYDGLNGGIVELALSVFHARALEISIRMIEQAFNKQDVLDPVFDDILPEQAGKLPVRTIFSSNANAKKDSRFGGVVIPFRPRAASPANHA